MNRRDFILNSLKIGAGFSFLPFPDKNIPNLISAPVNSRVVEIVNPAVRTSSSFDAAVISGMLDEGISLLYGNEKPQTVWKNLFPARHTVGIKVNCLSGRHGASHTMLVDAVIEKLRRAGIPPGSIIIWDRLDRDLENAGFSLNRTNRNKVRCFGNDTAGFDRNLYMNGSVGSLVSRTLTQFCDSVINIPVLKDHGIVGVTLSMKNFFGAIHNPNKYHAAAGNPFVADLYEMDIIRRKSRLIICDALDAQYEGGPPFKPQWVWPMNGLLLALDGVALDRVGWEIIERKRAETGFPPLEKAGRKPGYILTAGQKGIGQSQLNEIEWVKSGV